MNEGTIWQSKSHAEILADQTIVVRRVNRLSVLLGPRGYEGLVVVRVDSEVHFRRREKVRVIDIGLEWYVRLIFFSSFSLPPVESRSPWQGTILC